MRCKFRELINAQIAQLVEQRTENPRVAGSIPALGIFLFFRYALEKAAPEGANGIKLRKSHITEMWCGIFLINY